MKIKEMFDEMNYENILICFDFEHEGTLVDFIEPVMDEVCNLIGYYIENDGVSEYYHKDSIKWMRFVKSE